MSYLSRWIALAGFLAAPAVQAQVCSLERRKFMIALRRKVGTWDVLATGLEPLFDVVSGVRRMTDQQLLPLKALGIQITPQILDQGKWEAFWDCRPQILCSALIQ